MRVCIVSIMKEYIKRWVAWSSYAEPSIRFCACLPGCFVAGISSDSGRWAQKFTGDPNRDISSTMCSKSLPSSIKVSKSSDSQVTSSVPGLSSLMDMSMTEMRIKSLWSRGALNDICSPYGSSINEIFMAASVKTKKQCVGSSWSTQTFEELKTGGLGCGE